ncbi:MAG: HAMP domain-containing histidine kinase [Alphaproteobacteria bacterium]|nr:HAMP domain-containing histidine kinase [Alphaproteobacteria bacterium]
MLGSLVELVVEDPGLSEESRALLSRMQRTMRRMDGLMADLLDYADLGTAEGRAEPVHVGAALDCALEDLKPQLRASGAVVQRGPLPKAWGWPRLVEQVLFNLVSNAIKYRGEAPPIIEVRGEQRGDGMVEVRVSDQGPGIPPDKAEEVFTMFTRLEPEGPIPGTGIGLALCRRAVEAMGGQIHADRRAGPGAVIRFTLPAGARALRWRRLAHPGRRSATLSGSHIPGSPPRGVPMLRALTLSLGLLVATPALACGGGKCP